MFAGFMVFALAVLASHPHPQLETRYPRRAARLLLTRLGILEFTYANIATFLVSDFVGERSYTVSSRQQADSGRHSLSQSCSM